MKRIHVVATSHGTDNRHGREQIHRLRAALEEHSDFQGSALVWHEAYVDVQEPRLPEVLAALPAGEPAVVLPLLVAEGVHTTEDIAQAVAGREHTIAAAALGALPELARVLATRAGEYLEQADLVVLAAAGTRLPAGREQIRQLAQQLQQRLERPVQVGYCAGAEPRVAALVDGAPGRNVLVLSALLADGYFQDRLHNTGAWQVTRPLLPEVMITKCFLGRLEQALQRPPQMTEHDEAAAG